MTKESKKLVREEPARPRRLGRVERHRGEEPEDDREEEDRGAPRLSRRPDVPEEVFELQRGVMMAGLETVAATLDLVSNVVRNAADRAASADYHRPGDLIRTAGKDAQNVARDALDDLREIPRRATDSFYEAAKPRRRSDGERARRARNPAPSDEE